MTHQPRRPTVRPIPLAVLAGALLVVGGCTTASSGSGTSEAAVAPAPAVAAAEPKAVDGAASQADAAAGTSANGAGTVQAGAQAAAAVEAQKLVRTATMQVAVDDVVLGAAQVRAIATGAGGLVRSEQVGTGSGVQPVPATDGSGATTGAPGSGGDAGVSASPADADASTALAQLTIAVPAARLDGVLDQLARLGTVQQRTSSTQDVTQQHVDTQSRITTMKASIERLRALMAQTTSIDQVVRLESELADREADLESLEAQLPTLDQQVALSTVSVILTPRAATASTTPADSGFVAGLRAGWSAFTSALGGFVTLLGVVLPFLGLALVLGLPLLVWWRRRRTPAPASAPAPSTSAGSTGPAAAPEARQVAVPAGAPAAEEEEAAEAD